ncbi:helix-turn-helix transcriptional regulator [Micromonospora olivasterospora]|uniref:HTH domain-containing protein n=1 Tax=Micromonospora olivasterospora TaxID=1880 RepID=A0A562I2Z6_MICOL|nr:HTH domain-containing protein [Micromonospora olivasterospora]
MEPTCALRSAPLATELKVSVRTIYRDVVALGTAGIPVHADPTGYRLVDGYRTHLTGLTADEARGLVLAGLPGAAADLGLAEAVAAAQLKLTAALPETLRERATRMRQRFHLDTPGWYHDGDNSEHLAAVADAVWRQQAVAVRYETWTRLVDRRLDPYGLVLKAGKWYLVAARRLVPGSAADRVGQPRRGGVPAARRARRGARAGVTAGAVGGHRGGPGEPVRRRWRAGSAPTSGVGHRTAGGEGRSRAARPPTPGAESTGHPAGA